MPLITYKTPLQIRPNSLKMLIYPQWQARNFNGSSATANTTCDGIYDYINNTWIIQTATTKQALWKRDSEFGGKWYLKPDGVDDEYINTILEPFTGSSNFQIFVVKKEINETKTYIETSKFRYFTSSGLFDRFAYNLNATSDSYLSAFFFSPDLLNSWVNKNVSIFIEGKTTRKGRINRTSPSNISTIGGGGSVIPISGVKIFNGPNGYTSSPFAFIAVWEDPVSFTDLEIEDLMMFGQYEFGCHRNYNI